MATAVNMTDLEGKGDFGKMSPADLLGALENADATVRVWLETEVGVGQVAMRQGKVVTAEVGPLRQRSALLRILAMTEGTFNVTQSDVFAAPPIVPDVSTALELRKSREDEWRTLCESCPAMSSVLDMSAAGRAAKRDSTGTDRIIYSLVDGHRTVMAILGDSGLDPIDALRAIVSGAKSGYFEDIDNSASLLPLPSNEASAAPVKLPSAPQVPSFQTDVPETRRPFKLGIQRHGTLVGLGLDVSGTVAVPPQAVGATASLPSCPIIDIGEEPPSSHSAGAEVVASAILEVQPTTVEQEPSSLERGAVSEPADTLLGRQIPTQDGAGQEPTHGVRYVGRYEVLHRIGRGGMGSVYLARLSTEGGFRRLFALKLLRSYLAQDSAAAEAFLAEARLAGQLHHPNVVSVIDAGVHEGQPFLVMDYVEGCSLKQLMSAHPDDRPPRLIVPIILSALDGLSAVHNLRGDDGTPLNVVHCDVSPENLLIGADGICRLTDFGVARHAQLTGATNIHGKPAYAAPEQVTGGAIDRRADIFSLGVVLWSALTGERLFHGNSFEDTLRRVCSHPIPPPSTVGLRPPGVIDTICLKALERNRDSRYLTAEQMQADLREAAMREGLIGLNSEVASWVRRTVGQQLTQRRLLVLEASRPNDRRSIPPDDAGVPAQPSNHPASKFASSVPPSIPFSELEEEPHSRTMALGHAEARSTRRKQTALTVAATLTVIFVVVAVLWPNVLFRVFKMDAQSQLPPANTGPISVGGPVSINGPRSTGGNLSGIAAPVPQASASSALPSKAKEQ